MKRGSRILLLLVIVILVLIAVAYFVLRQGISFLPGGAAPTPTQPLEVKIIVVAQPIKLNDEIKKESLTTQSYYGNPTDRMIIDPLKAIGKYAAYPLAQGQPLTTDLLADRPGLSQPGSEAAKVVQPGMVAISVPISKLGLVSFAIRDGDKVNVIATSRFVDVDPNFQSKTPNFTSIVTGPGFEPNKLPILSAGISTIGAASTQGRAELDPTLNQAIYLAPSEAQHPRMTSQMILQDIQVLHVGEFDLPGQQAQAQPEAQPTQAGQPTPTPLPPVIPAYITLIVHPQDAVDLTYLINSNAIITLVLRAPDDTSKIDTEAATLQYLLSQYAMPVPPKLPYIMDNVTLTPAP